RRTRRQQGRRGWRVSHDGRRILDARRPGHGPGGGHENHGIDVGVGVDPGRRLGHWADAVRREAGIRPAVGTMRVPWPPARAAARWRDEVMMHCWPPSARNRTAAMIFGSMLPAANWPSAMWASASAAVI